jgi:hypothetical protein
MWLITQSVFVTQDLEDRLQLVRAVGPLQGDWNMISFSAKSVRAVFLLLVVFAGVNSFSQTSKGTLAGTVRDASGAVVHGATVVAKDIAGGEVRTATTGTGGEYRIEAINPSYYELTISSPSFATQKIERLQVLASVITSYNAQLKPASTSEVVQVEASGNTVQSESAELSANIPEVEITELPIVGLNPIALVLTEPGVVRVSQRDDFTNGASFSVDGLRPRSNNFLLDGFDNNDNGIQGQAIQPQNLEAVKEVVIQTNSYAPEFGRGGGSVTNVIYASGTNNWHGALWELYNGSGFNAIKSEEARDNLTTVPRTVENIYGFKLGGPIVHRKLFAFGSSQWDKLRGLESGSQITLPTANGIATLQSFGGTNPNVQTLLASLGGLTAPSADTSIAVGNRSGCNANPCSVELGSFARHASQLSDAYEYVVRVDFVAGDKDTLAARFLGSHNSLTPDLFANPNALPGTDTTQAGPSRNLGIFWTHVLSPRAVNELRFTSQTLNFGFDPTAKTLANPFQSLPDIEVDNLVGVDFGGLTTGFPQDRNHSIYQYQEAYSFTVGKHNFKAGADITHLHITDQVPFNSRGTLSYLSGGDCSAIGLATCTGLANFIDDFSGDGGAASKQFGLGQVRFTQNQQSYYFQDEWKARPNVTLTYGVRYEYQGTPLNALPFPAVNEATALTDPLTLVVKEKGDTNNFGPRLGFTYSPRFWNGLFGENKTVLRAGFGTFYDVLFTNILDNNAASTPNVTGGTTTGSVDTSNPSAIRGQPALSTVIPSITGVLSPTDSVTTTVANLRNPLTYQWNVNIQRQLPGDWLASVAYVGTRGERLFLNQELNPGVDGVRLNPNRGGIFARGNHGDSIYHGMQLKGEHNFKHGVLFRGAYTWSRAIDNGSEVFVTSGQSTRAQNQFSFTGDRGPSAFHRTQRAVFTFVYQVPGLTALGRGVNQVTKGWQFSGTSAFESGAPETLSSGIDANGDLSGFNDRPSVGNLAVPINYSAACRDPNGTCNTGVGFSNDGVTFVDFNSSFGFDPNTGNFTAKASDFRYLVVNGKLGNIGRNSFYNPGRVDWALSLQRDFKLPIRHAESQELSVRMEAFNPFNHPNLGGGEDGVPSVSGLITNGSFLNVSQTSVGGRTVRFWMKYAF